MRARCGSFLKRDDTIVSTTSIGRIGESLTIDFRVRYGECDSMGYLYHGRYWEYFEEARTELLRRLGVRYRDLEREGVFFVVYKAQIKYLAPIRYDDIASVLVRVSRITRTRVDHDYEVYVDGRRTTEASSTLACVGRDGRPITMPEVLWVST